MTCNSSGSAVNKKKKRETFKERYNTTALSSHKQDSGGQVTLRTEEVLAKKFYNDTSGLL